jgi:hypothetical protein
VVVLFIDGTCLDKLGRNTATPIVASLFNYTMEVLHSDISKKLMGFFPDVLVTKEQNESKEVKYALKQMQMFVLQKMVDMMREEYDKGGELFTDSLGIEWHIVPLLCLISTDMKEARSLKCMFEAYNQNMPCNLCTVLYKDCDKYMDPQDLDYRSAAYIQRAVRKHLKAKRYR